MVWKKHVYTSNIGFISKALHQFVNILFPLSSICHYKRRLNNYLANANTLENAAKNQTILKYYYVY